mmetsp:Transcript_13552/g.29787  ORF Transcript_13552/g.29787 Transcript_13552/m.29787 type:complete len:92 (+) Transcript_13552:117-392(+)
MKAKQVHAELDSKSIKSGSGQPSWPFSAHSNMLLLVFDRPHLATDDAGRALQAEDRDVSEADPIPGLAAFLQLKSRTEGRRRPRWARAGFL